MLQYPKPINITEVVIKNRVNCCGHRFRDIEVRVTQEMPELSKNEKFSGRILFLLLKEVTLNKTHSGGVLLGRYEGPGWTDQPQVKFGNQSTVGQFVVVQRNSHGWINIAEISVITGKAGEEISFLYL